MKNSIKFVIQFRIMRVVLSFIQYLYQSFNESNNAAQEQQYTIQSIKTGQQHPLNLKARLLDNAKSLVLAQKVEYRSQGCPPNSTFALILPFLPSPSSSSSIFLIVLQFLSYQQQQTQSIQFPGEATQMAANCILVEDNLDALVAGIEEGRRLNSVKKAICYSLTSQIGQLLPFICFVFLQIPCPITCALVLQISIANRLVPAIALSFQESELGLMTRRPRRKQQNLAPLLAQSYGFMGWTQFWRALICFYVTFNDFSFPPAQLTGLANIRVVKSNPGDSYNPTHPTFGNTYLLQLYSTGCPPADDPNSVMVDWIHTGTASYDLRNTLLKCTVGSNGAVYAQAVQWGDCKVNQISPFTNMPICFTPEAAKYAQNAYFTGIVWGQFFTFFACRTNLSSTFSQRVTPLVLFSLTVSLTLVLAAAYFQPLNNAFGTRDLIFMRSGISVIPFGMLQLVIDELRKYMMRELIRGRPHWFHRATFW